MKAPASRCWWVIAKRSELHYCGPRIDSFSETARVVGPSLVRESNMPAMQDPRYEVENPLIKDLLLELAKMLGKKMPVGWGFTLFLFSYGEKGDIFYLSSAKRDDMVRTIKEWLRKQGETTL